MPVRSRRKSRYGRRGYIRYGFHRTPNYNYNKEFVKKTVSGKNVNRFTLHKKGRTSTHQTYDDMIKAALKPQVKPQRVNQFKGHGFRISVMSHGRVRIKQWF